MADTTPTPLFAVKSGATVAAATDTAIDVAKLIDAAVSFKYGGAIITVDKGTLNHRVEEAYDLHRKGYFTGPIDATGKNTSGGGSTT